MTPGSSGSSASKRHRLEKPSSVPCAGTVRSARQEREVWWETLSARSGRSADLGVGRVCSTFVYRSASW
jgi:hypothetical protein